MEIIIWNKDYLTGHGTIDFQHKILVGIINDLIESQWNKVGDELWIEVVLDELKSYTQYHFSTESHLMKKHGYSEIKHHAEQHLVFVEKLVTFREEYAKDPHDINSSLLEFLKDWLLNHILKEDKKLVSFLNDQDSTPSET